MKSSWKDDQVKAISEKQLKLNVMTAAWSYWKTAVVSYMSCVGCSALIWKIKQKINMECQDIIFTETLFQLYVFYSHILESCLLFILLWLTVCIVFSSTSKAVSSFMEYKEKICKKESLQQTAHNQPFLIGTMYGTIQYLLLVEIADTRTICVRCLPNTELCSHIDMVVNLNYNIFSFSSNYQFCLIITFMLHTVTMHSLNLLLGPLARR